MMNSPGLTIDPVFPAWVILLTSAVVFSFFIWKEIQRNQRFLIARIIAQIIVTLSLLGLLLKPSYREEKLSTKSILLTNGYDQQKADSILKKYPHLKIYRTPDANTLPSAELLNDYQQLFLIGEDVQFILGEGLPPDALALINKKNFRFIPGTTPDGIVQIFIEKPVKVNETTKLHGLLKTKQSTVLKFSGLGIEDSVTLKGSGVIPFSFLITPKQTGFFVSTLTSQGTNPVSEKLPIEVVSGEKLKILVLQKYPTAEVKYLKNYLAEKGHIIALRYQTSRNNYKYEFANSESFRVDKLTPELATSLDLVFTDSEVLGELSTSEKNALESAIRGGLGLIILEIPEKGKTIGQFLSVSTKKVAYDTVHIRLASSRIHVLPVQPIQIVADPSIQPITLHRDRILSGYQYAGGGKVAFQLLKETYKARLEGNIDDYAAIWSPLIERTAKNKNKMFRLSIGTSFPYYSNESLPVDIISSGANPILLSDDASLPATEDVIIDDLWHVTSWGANPGWHQFLVKQDSTRLQYFISDNDEWKAVRFGKYVKANLLAQSNISETIEGDKKYEPKEISALIFFFTFLLSFGFLWLAPKI